MLSTPEFADFIHFVRMRHALYLHRRQNTEPAVIDPCFRYKFTNIYRILDRMTQYHVETINRMLAVLPTATTDDINKFAAIIYVQQLFNRTDVIGEMPHNIWRDIPNNIENLRRWCAQRHISDMPLFSGAYNLCTYPYKATKYDMYLDALIALLEKDQLASLYNATTVQERYDIFQQLEGFSDFLSYQFALTFSYIRECTDYDDFIVPGPGAKRGLRIVFPDRLSSEYYYLMRFIVDWMASTGEFNIEEFGVKLRPRGNDVQNMFCEYSKYHKLQEGKKPRRVYKSEHEWALSQPIMPAAWIHKGSNM